jgi:DNA-binding response OmpR family regulator
VADPVNPGHERPDSILVVDDEPSLLESVAYSLRREGFTVNIAVDGPAAIAMARTHAPDLVLLDVMLPGMDGLQVLRALRAESNVPIIMVSARVEEVDRVVGLEIGADDYLTKPFAMRELIARVRANLRRVRMVETNAAREEGIRGAGSSITKVGNLTVDVARRQASIAGVPLTLKPKEFELLAFLAGRPGVVVSRDLLLRDVWGYDYHVDTRTVDVHVRWLRQRLQADPPASVKIETMRGFGYRLVVGEVS